MHEQLHLHRVKRTMTYAILFIRFLFTLVNILFMTAFILNGIEQPTLTTYLTGTLYGLLTASLMLLFERYLKRITFRLLILTMIGLVLGYTMGLCLNILFTTLLHVTLLQLHESTIAFVKLSILLCSTYLGVILSYRYSEELYLRIPFIHSSCKIKKILIDLSALADPRIVDIAATGVLDQRVVISRSLLNELQAASNQKEDVKIKRALENSKKLENLPALHLMYREGDLPAYKQPMDKLLQLAENMHADVLTAEHEKIQKTLHGNVRIISLYDLSKALKPLMQGGEYLTVKVQRLGKEEKQGVGYLDDGTMVVVNGAADFIGDMIEARVLSVKHTQSGRLVFCNLVEDM